MPITLTRSLLVILIPGGIVVAPWLLWLLLRLDGLSALYSQYTFLFNLSIFGAIVIAGSILEGLGTHQETVWDGWREEEFEVEENWYYYLAKVCVTEPVGFRYLGRLVTTMYFELSMSWASALFGLGAGLALSELRPNSADYWYFFIVLLSICLFGYFRWQAYNSHRCLCKGRREINRLLRACS